MHLVKLQLKPIVEDLTREQVRHFDCHVAFVVIEEFTRVVRLKNLVDSDVDQLTNDWCMLRQVLVQLEQEVVVEFKVIFKQ